MGPRRAGVLFLTLVALAGCGGDDNDKEEEAINQDVAAKSEARELSVEMEACFVDAQSYTDCSAPSAGGDVSYMTAVDAYTASVPSESGNTFKIGKNPAGELVKTCEEAGEAGCPEDGRW